MALDQQHHLLLMSKFYLFFFPDAVVMESEGGSPCHKGTEDVAPIGSFTCNQNTSICLGKISSINNHKMKLELLEHL